MLINSFFWKSMANENLSFIVKENNTLLYFTYQVIKKYLMKCKHITVLTAFI